MKDKELTKKRISNLVMGYKTLFPEEYAFVVNQIEAKRRTQGDEFAQMKLENPMLERALYEVPEKLFIAFMNELETEEHNYIKGQKSKEGARWFARTFKEFALAEKI